MASYEGAKGHEHVVCRFKPDGNIDNCGKLEGPKGQERHVRHVFPDGRTEHFEGSWRGSGLIKRKRPDGRVERFKNPWKIGRLARCTFPNGQEMRYGGAPGMERLVPHRLAQWRPCSPGRGALVPGT